MPTWRFKILSNFCGIQLRLDSNLNFHFHFHYLLPRFRLFILDQRQRSRNLKHNVKINYGIPWKKFFSLLLLSTFRQLWHGERVYNCHLCGLVTLTPTAKRGAVTTCFYNFFCRSWDSNSQPSTSEANTVANCATAVVYCSLNLTNRYAVRKIGWTYEN